VGTWTSDEVSWEIYKENKNIGNLEKGTKVPRDIKKGRK
jgi:hypothetical protein